jgi:hypothetical protein
MSAGGQINDVNLSAERLREHHRQPGTRRNALPSATTIRGLAIGIYNSEIGGEADECLGGDNGDRPQAHVETHGGGGRAHHVRGFREDAPVNRSVGSPLRQS